MQKPNTTALDISKVDINVTFYTLIKRLNSVDLKLSVGQVNTLLSSLYQHRKADNSLRFEALIVSLESTVKNRKLDTIKSLFVTLNTEPHFLTLLEYSLQLLLIKPHLLSEAKLSFDITVTEEKAKHHQLSLEYDKVSSYQPYYLRVNGALLSLLFFEQLTSGSTKFLSSLIESFALRLRENHKILQSAGLEPNQIFLIMFSEVIDQSIKASAGGSYEDRIKEVLVAIGIPNESISKKHDENDSSTEYDFFFTYKSKRVGIGAKRTLRERYKQFTNTSKDLAVDLMIEITLGTDLTETRVDTITKNFGVILLISDEIYNYTSNEYLRKNTSVFPASSFNTNLLDQMLSLQS